MRSEALWYCFFLLKVRINVPSQKQSMMKGIDKIITEHTFHGYRIQHDRMQNNTKSMNFMWWLFQWMKNWYMTLFLILLRMQTSYLYFVRFELLHHRRNPSITWKYWRFVSLSSFDLNLSNHHQLNQTLFFSLCYRCIVAYECTPHRGGCTRSISLHFS